MRSVLATYLTIPAFELASSVKISNFEAHAEYVYSTPYNLNGTMRLHRASAKGMRIDTSRGHLLLLHLLLKIPSVRSLDCSDEALSKRLFYKM